MDFRVFEENEEEGELKGFQVPRETLDNQDHQVLLASL